MRLLRLLTLFLLFVIASPVSAANYFVTPTGSGARTGADWTNALPEGFTPARGNTYYIADGTYAAKTWNTATSGATAITIKKCTTIDGVSSEAAGYVATMCDGQAVFNRWTVSTSYWTFDGNGTHTAPSNNSADYGFKLDCSTCAAATRAFFMSAAVGNIILRYVDMEGDGSDSGKCTDVLYGIQSGTGPITMQYLYLHEASRAIILSGNWTGGATLLEYSWLEHNHSEAACHGETWAHENGSDLTIRFNRFQDVEGTGLFVCLNRVAGGTTCDDVKFYGNVVHLTGTWDVSSSYRGFGNGPIACVNDENCSNWKIYNNTFVDIADGGVGSRRNCNVNIDTTGTATGWETYNNLFWNCSTVTLEGTHNYNFFKTGDTHGAEANAQETASNPFTNYAGNVFTLASGTNAGRSLTSPFNTDVVGSTRGADGIWDRGAFEFRVGDSRVPNPPDSIQVQDQ